MCCVEIYDVVWLCCVFFFKQKTAYEMRISDWSSDVCSSDLLAPGLAANAIMAFSHLGELDAAYRVATGLFEGRGPVVQQARGKGIRDLYSGEFGRASCRERVCQYV